jgi:hypothetical protein
MKEANNKGEGWKSKFVNEITEYAINFLYLAVFFGVFTFYRRLVLAEYQISYMNYGFSLIKALILAKVIMIGSLFHLGGKYQDKPLIYPVLYNTIVFTIWVAVFFVLEDMVVGLLHGKGLAGGWQELKSRNVDELLARCVVILFAFIPFFAFKELGRVIGNKTIVELFFRGKKGTEFVT